MSHSPEPWKVEPSDEHEGRFEIDHAGYGSVPGCDGLFEEDARRIAACVNACAGVPTELIEAVDQKEIISAIGTREAILQVLQGSPDCVPHEEVDDA